MKLKVKVKWIPETRKQKKILTRFRNEKNILFYQKKISDL